MDSQTYWQLFLQTGSPEAYISFNRARRMEAINVFENQGAGSTRNSL